MTIFINGRQKRVRRPQPLMVKGMGVDEFILGNADPVWLNQNEMWELIDPQDYTQIAVPADDGWWISVGDDREIPHSADDQIFSSVDDDDEISF
jgi:hypothetical protein